MTQASAAPGPAPGQPRQRSTDDLVAGVLRGDVRSVARVISLVEDGSPALPELAAALAPHAGRARVVGITGSPGVGKSTTTSALVTLLRAEGRRVGVLAVDPTSPFSGGALLGDRVRMQEHATDPGVFIRSMASRGHLGGLAGATPQAVRVLDAAGCDDVLVETVGVGQSEVEVAALADTTVVVLAPGMGDAIQAAKAGILEVADVFVVNKADREGADTTVRELRAMVSLGRREAAEPGSWRPPIVTTVATAGEGLSELLAAVAAHQEWLDADGRREQRRARRHAAEVEALAWQTWHTQWFDGAQPTGRLAQLAREVEEGRTDPYAAAAELIRAWRASP